jgi:hypothetical protein
MCPRYRSTSLDGRDFKTGSRVMGLVLSKDVAVQIAPALRTRCMNDSIKLEGHPDYVLPGWF